MMDKGRCFVSRELSKLALYLLGLLMGSSAVAAPERFSVELEGGAAWQSRNDVGIPGDGGTRFSLADLTGEGPYAAYRVYVNYAMSPRSGLRLLYAPLRLTETGTLDKPVHFDGVDFDPGVDTEGTYQFNSYRLTYHTLFYQSHAWQWRVGFTAKVRDAEIKLKQGDKIARNSNVGLVPLLHLGGQWQFAERWHWLLDMDALASPQGRAIDLALKLEYDLADQWRVAAGYRTVEGGADNENVYTFAWFNYAVASLTYRF